MTVFCNNFCKVCQYSVSILNFVSALCEYLQLPHPAPGWSFSSSLWSSFILVLRSFSRSLWSSFILLLTATRELFQVIVELPHPGTQELSQVIVEQVNNTNQAVLESQAWQTRLLWDAPSGIDGFNLIWVCACATHKWGCGQLRNPWIRGGMELGQGEALVAVASLELVGYGILDGLEGVS